MELPSQEALIIFSGYPEPGKTKTRLIPALGAEGAAQLQKRLSEHTIKQSEQLLQTRSVTRNIYFAGGDAQLMKEWLGDQLNYFEQAPGDLGVKICSAFADSFAKDRERVVIIGIDCPGVNSDILTTAFESLKDNQLVLGTAADGGYYLVGLQKNAASLALPKLFTNINWGTSEVLAATKSIADDLGLKVVYLKTLRDIDRPEDLDLVDLIEA